MSRTVVQSPTSRLRVGIARVDITPPVGIYQPVWGAARHTRSTGIHRPLFGDVIAVGSCDATMPRLLYAVLDLGNLPDTEHESMLQILAEASNIPVADCILAYSHTHSAGLYSPDRVPLPGGELIPAFLEGLRAKLVQAARTAVQNMQDVFVTYGIGHCSMSANRDYWDAPSDQYVCGFNPSEPSDDTVMVARIADLSGKIRGTVVNYACHPTTLAWENSLISPDYVGALRDRVEQDTDAPCIFVQGACGNLGPRYGYSGDVTLADQNGTWLAYAALAALNSMGPPATDYQYQGPVVSGATLGTWGHVGLSAERLAEVSRFEGGQHRVDLPLKPKPDPDTLERELALWLDRQKEADERGDVLAARDCGARAERARRKLARVGDLPDGTTYTFHFSVYRMGDAIWVLSGGQPYDVMQVKLRERFSDRAILVACVAGDMLATYLLPEERYGKGLYQENATILGAGCLETLTEAIGDAISALC